MCGIFGAFGKNAKRVSQSYDKNILNHRGPDYFGTFLSKNKNIYFAHNRLSIIGLDESSNQPLHGENGLVIICNGEIYNYKDLKQTLVKDYPFKSNSDTEVILALYEKYDVECVKYLRGMFSFALWDERKQRLFCARDRFGIKPFYYMQKQDSVFVFASEIKALLPFIDNIKTDMNALGEYLTFQYTLGEQTLFDGINQLMPGYFLLFKDDNLAIKKYWDVSYQIDYDHSEKYFEEKLHSLLVDSIKYHTISDVPLGSYLSGGIDSSLMTVLGTEQRSDFYGSFHGKFTEYEGYDESFYAQMVTDSIKKDLFVADITSLDFIDNLEKVIYHLDVPVAGPGSFPQYMVSKLVSKHVKVVLGGQGGDEIFGGYARYVLAYFEQTLKAAVEGTYQNGAYVVTPESIIPNLTLLGSYKPLIQSFFKDGLFGSLDERYFRLIDRSVDSQDEIDWSLFDRKSLIERFKFIFNNSDNVGKQAYFDKMTHFDFKCLLPALLHVEDRMSMAHGVESRVPFLDHKLIEFAATIPADIKFPGGQMKALLKKVFKKNIPEKIINRKDKMGFPVPLKEWFSGPLKDFVYDIFSSQVASTRGFYDPKKVLLNLEKSSKFSRKIWGLLSLELWYREFHDKRSGAQLELWKAKKNYEQSLKGASI